MLHDFTQFFEKESTIFGRVYVNLGLVLLCRDYSPGI